MSDADHRPGPRPRGFSTRAIRAASRSPRIDQVPTSVPIYQTATFASADADELGRVAGDPRAGYALRVPELTASLGSVHTMVVHPPSTSQRHLSEAELEEAGITPGLLRVSVGLEDLEDLQADLSAALAAAQGATTATREPVPAVGAI